MLHTKPPESAVVPLPRQIQIEPVGHCNLQCGMCVIRFRREGPPHGPPALMEMQVFKDLIDQFWTARELHLQGLGEPLLHPDLDRLIAEFEYSEHLEEAKKLAETLKADQSKKAKSGSLSHDS